MSQTVSLEKKQSVNLSKKSPGLSKVALGLGWSPAKAGGFLGKMMGGNKEIDLDASCVMLDANGREVDVVWFRKYESNCGAIKHSGDNRTGKGDGDDETIYVDLTRLPANVVTLAFTVNSFTGQTFDKVEDAYCKVYDMAQGKAAMAHFPLAEKGSHTGVFIASLSKQGNEWHFTAQGKACPGRMIGDMLPTILRELA